MHTNARKSNHAARTEYQTCQGGAAASTLLLVSLLFSNVCCLRSTLALPTTKVELACWSVMLSFPAACQPIATPAYLQVLLDAPCWDAMLQLADHYSSRSRQSHPSLCIARNRRRYHVCESMILLINTLLAGGSRTGDEAGTCWRALLL